MLVMRLVLHADISEEQLRKLEEKLGEKMN